MPRSRQLWAIRASPRRAFRRFARTRARSSPARSQISGVELDERDLLQSLGDIGGQLWVVQKFPQYNRHH